MKNGETLIDKKGAKSHYTFIKLYFKWKQMIFVTIKNHFFLKIKYIQYNSVKMQTLFKKNKYNSDQ